MSNDRGDKISKEYLLCKYILIYPRLATTEVTKFQKNIRCANIFSYIHDLIMIIVTPGHQVILLPCSRVPESLGILFHLKFDKDWNNAIDQPSYRRPAS